MADSPQAVIHLNPNELNGQGEGMAQLFKRMLYLELGGAKSEFWSHSVTLCE